MSSLMPEVFLVNLAIGNPSIGGIMCTVNLGVTPETKKANGRSVIFQSKNPPLLVESIVAGTYDYLCTNGKCFVMIHLKGYMGTEGSFGENFNASILLDDDWESGTANYSYLHQGEWEKKSNQPVKSTKIAGIDDLKKLAEIVRLQEQE
ncbi:DUF1842 domain-containing protein [Kordia jejudonensis]|uniref:DUF1842 domain-containing protein n=1 Tax=Kordia jejudonensis TaxID=1348245 RepID=UPI0006292969|nr:DUF1842 domain-containing protein [Kordia jejudonensis]